MKRNGVAKTRVCVVHSAAERALAEAVANRFEQNGMAGTLYPFALPVTEEVGKRLWRAADASRALAVVLPREPITSPGLPSAIGVGQGGEVPVFVLLTGEDLGAVPDFLKPYPAFPLWAGLPMAVAGIRKLPDSIPA